MLFGEHIYRNFVNFVGKGINYLDCGWYKTQFQFSVKKKQTKWNVLLSSTKQCPGCFTCSASFNWKEKNLQVKSLQNAHFKEDGTEAQRH